MVAPLILAPIAVIFLANCQTAKHATDAPLVPLQEEKISVPTPLPPFSAYELGKRALSEKKGEGAVQEFSRCLEESGNVECRWELGWAFFLEHDYEKAREQWELVGKTQPDREGLKQALEKITLHIEVMTRAKKLRASVPKSFVPRKLGASLVRVHAVGDTMLGTDFPEGAMLPPEGVSPLAESMDLLKGSDITFANYEGTLCDGGATEKCETAQSGTCYAFRSPRRFASFLRDAGFDLVSLANNHIADFGEECREQTEKSLDGVGIPWSGKAGTVARFERAGRRYSMIAFHSALHTNSTLDLEAARKFVQAEVREGRIVLISFHGGAEGIKALYNPHAPEFFAGEKRGDVTRFARAMVDAGADLVVGSGPHVVRAMEIYRDRLIAYSLGNFATYKAFNIWGFNGVGLVLEADLDPKGRFVGGRILPTRQVGFGVPKLDPKGTSIDLIRLLSKEDFPQTAVVVARDGTLGRKSEVRRRMASERKAKRVYKYKTVVESFRGQ